MLNKFSSQQPLTDPTTLQRAASDPAASAWVNASAGSGKTKVLTERVTRLLLAGVAPEKILCLTFTRAGAAEMANRVTQRLAKWAACDDQTLDQDLFDLQNRPAAKNQHQAARRLFARVLSCPGGLRIRTIHSFCQEILARFPIEAGLQPHFKLIDEQEQEALRNQTLDRLLSDAAQQPDGDLARHLEVLIAAQSEVGVLQMLREIVRLRGRLAAAATKAGGVAELLAQIRGVLNLERGDNVEFFRAEAMQNIDEASLRLLAGWMRQGSKTFAAAGQKLAHILDLDPVQRAEQFNNYCAIFLTGKKEPRKKIAAAAQMKAHPEIEDTAGNEALRLISVLERIEAVEILALTESVLFFGGAYAALLARAKADRAALDYDDLILKTLELLTRRDSAEWIRYKLDNGLDHILVDEAQDTSRAQWRIVEALTAEFTAGEGAQKHRRSLFVVGDEKQSIFSFQNADPEAFLAYQDGFAQQFAAADLELRQIPFHTSFRSAPMILQAVDAIFSAQNARAGVSRDPVSHSAFPDKNGLPKCGRIEIWPLLKAVKEKNTDHWVLPLDCEEEQDTQAELARQIATKIKGWLMRRETLPGGTRPIAPDDIMILLRSRGRFADLMVRALKAVRAPVTGVDRMHLMKQLPVMDVLALARFVLLPDDDLNLACVLRGPLLGLGEDDLMKLAIGRDSSLWQSIKDHATEFSAPYEYLTAQLTGADTATPFAFLSNILNTPCPANDISGRKALWTRLGDEALDPIEELLNQAAVFSRRETPSLQNFLHWLSEADAEIKRELDSGGGQVRIMTVHAAKGLEAPIVFLPDAASLPRPQDIAKLQWADNDTPLYLARQPMAGMARHLWQQARDRQLQEYRRLFYVALTRAINRLYICGWLDKNAAEFSAESWYGLAVTGLKGLHQAHDVDAAETPVPDIVMSDPVLAVEAVIAKPAAPSAVSPLPYWAWRKAAVPKVAATLIAAQQSALDEAEDAGAAATPDAAFARGRLIHRLLQSLPDVAPEHHSVAVQRYLRQPQHALNEDQIGEIESEVTALLQNENFAELFGADSVAEVALTGIIDGMAAFRQIDRLCVRGDEVWIVDYKTNRPPPQRAEHIPALYRKQLSEYRHLLSGIYPDKKIRCFLLWTYAPQLMEVEF